MEISTLSKKLKTALCQEMENITRNSSDGQTQFCAETAMLQAMKIIVQRIEQGEEGLFDPTNSGDNLAIALASM